MSLFSDLFRGGKNPASAAMPYINQVPAVAQTYFSPFVQGGLNAYPGMNNTIGQMSSDPAAFLESLMSRYEPSKAFQFKKDELLKAAGNTAAAGGMRGTTMDSNNQSKIVDALLNEDMQQWLSNVLGIQGAGLQGQENLYNLGLDATKSLTGDISNALGTQSTLAFQGQANQNKSQSDLLSGLIKALGGIAGFTLPGGGSIGGAIASKFI